MRISSSNIVESPLSNTTLRADNQIPAMWLINKKGVVVDFNGRKGLEEKVEKLLTD
jgi:hypothetical protein